MIQWEGNHDLPWRPALAVLALAVLASTPHVRAQEPRTLPWLAVFHVATAPTKLTLDFYDELARLGWVRDRTLRLEERFVSEGRGARVDKDAVTRDRFDLAINWKTGRSLGLSIPLSVLAPATRAIE